jgi:hypothetical protein
MVTLSFDASAALAALKGFSRDFAGEIIDNIAGRLAGDIFRKAFANLSGQKIPKKDWSNSPLAGSFPVPVRTGNLRRCLMMIAPGGYGSKMNVSGDLAALKTRYEVGRGEAYVLNSAAYAGVIENPAEYGRKGNPRPFLTGPAQEFLIKAPQYAEEELAKGIEKHGLE